MAKFYSSKVRTAGRCCYNLLACLYPDLNPADGVGRREAERQNAAQIFFE